MSKAKTFIDYALQGFYRQERRKAKEKKFFEISKANLVKVLGGSARLGSSQREDLLDACVRQGIAMVELADRFYFFDPEQLPKEAVFNMNGKVTQLKKITDEYDRLKRSEADKAWYDEFGGEEDE
ncbi:hypothetical protein [Bradyrhizobium sp. TM233]|uniref:hypothetical protein n=1 Tax=Bradyrhizobium sp. TM233 TaxID=2599801 RepID=UPI0030C684A2|nr:hypothetical protein TM233_02170 [Bradyrhizobium sp. TM233]